MKTAIEKRPGRAGLRGVFVAVGLLLMLMSSVASAATGDRLQEATGEGHVASATFASTPQAGNLIVAVSSHRVSWNEAHISGSGWNQALEMVFDADDTDIRRGLAVWYKTAGPDEPRTIRTWWRQDGSQTDWGRKNGLMIMEFEGTFMRDTAASDVSSGQSSSGVYTGMTDMSTTLPSLVVGFAHARENANEATWTNGLDKNYRYHTSGGWGDDRNEFTLQTAYRMSDENRAWDSEVFWGNSAGASIGAIAVFRPYEDTEWNFNCGSELTSEIEIINPAAMIMLDRSGSMGYTGCYYCLWRVAESSIRGVIQTLMDELDFGFGYYRNSSANIVVESTTAGSNQTIIDWFTGKWPSGGTPTHEGVRVMSESVTMQQPASAGILITDGVPNSGLAAINATCKAREEGKTNYVIGLGGGTDTNFNNLQAAAAGTGCCGPTANAECSNGIGFDPCDGPQARSDLEYRTDCYGSYSAANQDEFTNVLLDIGGTISCTFPLDVSGWPNGMIEDPRAVKVQVHGVQEIPHRDMSADGEGWYFSNSNLNSVTLTDGLCAQARDPEEGFSEVTTQVACSCDALVAEEPECLLSNVIATACPVGTKTCNPDQTWYCAGPAQPMNEDCPFFNCPEYEEPELCHVENEYYFNYAPPGQGGSSIVSSEDFDPNYEVNRCQVGVMACDEENGARCMPLSPMPEICNGLDNDCDGTVANFRESWTYYDDAYSLEDEDASGAACNLTDACICSEGPRGHGGLNAIFNGLDQTAEFSEYIDYYLMELENGESCVCQAL